MITIKTKEEIAILREGGARHAFILRELKGMVRAGLSTADLETRARELIAEGGDRPSFQNYTPHGAKRPYPSALCVCINDEVVHGIPSENPRIISPGDIVTIDLGLVHHKLFTDSAVSVVVPVDVGDIGAEVGVTGRSSAEQRDLQKKYESRSALLRVAEEALTAGIKAAKGGRHVGDIGSAIERVIRPTDAAIIAELCGHGLGYGVHEDPFVPNFGDPGTGELLKPGMIIAIEPILTLGKPKIRLLADGYTYVTVDGADSVQVEHTLLITKGDAEVLTR